jgi:hypothetical protein
MDELTFPVPSYPTLLVIDANEERAQRLARLLTLADYHAIVTNTPFQAFDRFLQMPYIPEAILLGQIDQQGHTSVLPRLMQRLNQQVAGAAIPTLTLPAKVPAEPPLHASPDSPAFHIPAQASLAFLEAIWQVLPATCRYSKQPRRSQVLSLLPGYGLAPRVTQQARSRSSHFRQVLQTAYDLMDAALWERLIGDVGLARYRRVTDWPANDATRAIPAEYLSLLHQAVAFSRPEDPISQLRRWGELGTQVSLKRRNLPAMMRQTLKLLPQERVMALALDGFTRVINEIRGEPLHAWTRWHDGSFRLVHYSNLYVYGRLAPPEPACHVWVASLEATLRLLRPDKAWEVSELECSCQTQTGHCLFACSPSGAN